jgi:hypothetical protein
MTTGKTPVLAPEEARALIGAALGMKVEDVFTQNRRFWVQLREKGGKAHAMPPQP